MAEPGGDDDAPQPVPVPPLSDEELEPRQAIFDELFAEFSPHDLKAKSKAEREETGRPGRGLTYSEMDFLTMHLLLNQVRSQHGPLYAGKGYFVDLGSGAGKACVAAALLHPFEKVVGIETLQSLSSAAAAVQAKYQEVQLPEGVVKPELDLSNGDFIADFEAKLEPIAPQIAVAFAVATLYEEPQIQALGNLARKMPDNSLFIIFSQRLPAELIIVPDRDPAQRRAVAVKRALAVRGTDPDTAEIVLDPPKNDPNGWTEVDCLDVELAWGNATCFVFKKIPQIVEEVLLPGADPDDAGA